MPERFDAIVIGTGQGGGPLAGQLAAADWKVDGQAAVHRTTRRDVCSSHVSRVTEQSVQDSGTARLG